jgi:hypothetical protein
MKKLMLLFISLTTQLIFSQSNSEIIRWLNDFENNNSPERIMRGTFDDKVFLSYANGYLTINSMALGPMSLNGTSSIYNYKIVYKINDIKQIEAIDFEKDGKIIYDIKICTNDMSSIDIYSKKNDDSEYERLSLLKFEKWIEKFGNCSSELRFKFNKEVASKQLQRVYDALFLLAKNHNANPKIGSYF